MHAIPTTERGRDLSVRNTRPAPSTKRKEPAHVGRPNQRKHIENSTVSRVCASGAEVWRATCGSRPAGLHFRLQLLRDGARAENSEARSDRVRTGEGPGRTEKSARKDGMGENGGVDVGWSLRNHVCSCAGRLFEA